MKRLLDICLAGAGLLVFLPFGVFIVIVLRLTGEGEVFYRQPRVGRGGRVFGLFKFVTMVKASPKIGSGDITLKNDPRVLTVGRFLRKTKLNEVPQLLNILLGDMSVIGPRPLTPGNFAFYAEDVKRIIARVRPGLSGVGSIVFRDEESMIARSSKPALQCYEEDIAPYKGQLERWYVQHQSLRLDILLILLTGWVVFFPKSEAYGSMLRGLPARDATGAPADEQQSCVARQTS
jgi:lipopolysaccharide/colanic/teichoic acid biosynthesis glycosyltransferase